MPKFGSHMLFAELASGRRPDLFPGLDLNALRLGAVGPDLTIFFFDPVTDSNVRKGFDLAIQVMEKLRDIKEKLDEIAGLFEGPVGDLADWLTGGLSADLHNVANTTLETLLKTATLGIAVGTGQINLSNPIFKAIAAGKLPADIFSDPVHTLPTLVVDSVDNYGFPFRYFGHPFTDDGSWRTPEPVGDYSNWWWMDLLHYRKTGQFASRLIARAVSPAQRSYANGYMTHVAGDICGHPFINALVGGPFRNHAYRHLVLETLADTWLWADQGRGDIIRSSLNDLIDVDEASARSIAALVVESMRETFKDPMLPRLLPGRYPSEDEFVTAYRLCQRYLKLATSGGVARPTPPPDTPLDLIKEIQDLLGRNSPGSPPNWNGNVVDYLAALFSWALKGVVLVAMIATLPFAVLMRFANIAPRWLLYLIHLGIFMVLSGIRMLLCLAGWGYAGKEDFESFAFLGDLVIAPPFDPQRVYPLQSLPRPRLPFYWLAPPQLLSAPELPQTVAGPIYGHATPSWMLDPGNQMDHATVDHVLRLYDEASPSGTIEREFGLAWERDPVFGNAVDFSIALLERTLPVPDLDLDGDRGFGFRPWQELPPAGTYHI